MIGDATQVQDEEERQRARNLSLQRQQPPTQVPGYEAERFLGAGAYGEVWVARDRNTGRRVAIKFYAHRGGLDWSLLSREVDKLVLLFTDRYVVQLIEVGWEADPPYYVMEYLEGGSLEDRLLEGRMPVVEAVELFREVAVALVHAHGKGVLHCDLKPANVLLDQDRKPRLADFGQSRLSHEQAPALGTLFYMAPEQADLAAAPDARWDVYALGALLYCMLTGGPPYRDENLAEETNRAGKIEQRLARYRQVILAAPKPSEHRHVPGVDHALAEIVDRCLATSPKDRFPNAQAVLDALDARAQRQARRPLLVLGALGPAIFLAVVSLLAWNGFHLAVNESTKSLTQSARTSNEFAAQVFADRIAIRIDRRWRIMENVADDPEFRDMVRAAIGTPRGRPPRSALQSRLETLHSEHPEIPSVAWFLLGPDGTMLARSPLDGRTIDRNFAFRDFFHGRKSNLREGSSSLPTTNVHRSIIYRSQATGRFRTVGFSVPVWSGEPDENGRHVNGVLVTTIEVGDFADFVTRTGLGNDLVPVLIDSLEDEHGRRGTVLIHPLLAELRRRHPHERLPDFHVNPATLQRWNSDYHDPAGEVDRDYSGRWLAASEPVLVDGRGDEVRNTGWVVIMQERYDAVIGPVVKLRHILVVRGALTLIAIVLVLTVLWGFVIHILNGPSALRFSALLRRRGGLTSDSLTSVARPLPKGLAAQGEPSRTTTKMPTESPTEVATESVP